MTVGELINELMKYDPDKEVVRFAWLEDMYEDFEYISFVDIDKDGNIRIH